MKFSEIKKDIFTVDQSYYIAHCISSDCAMGAGIAASIESRFHVRETLLQYPIETRKHPVCIRVKRIINLITKAKYYDKPTYESVEKALIFMRDICIISSINKIAMPTIASDLDKLNWAKVKLLIFKVFGDTDIEILVCKLK